VSANAGVPANAGVSANAGNIVAKDLPYKARIKTHTGKGFGLWEDNTKTDRVVAVPDGSVVTVIGKPDALGFALAEFSGMQGVGDTQYMIPLAGVPDLPPPEPPPWGEHDVWQKIAASYALLTQAANMMGDTLQDYGH
jgi:hypothetical protein